MTDDVLACVRGLSLSYGQLTAVKNISFEISRGEIIGLLGANGAGKTSTLQMLSGNLVPNSGSISINGFDLLTSPRQAKQALGYLPEIPPLYSEMTVTEYLSFCAKLRLISVNQQADAVSDAMDRCGLSSVKTRLIGQLSKGYQQRVGIAQAIIHRPDLVILDEPTVGLDPIQIREIRELIRNLAESHSVILSSHILPEIQMLCDRVLIIHQGELVLSDSIKGLQHRLQGLNVVVGFYAPPDVAALLDIVGVKRVEPLEADYFRLYFNDADQRMDDLVTKAVQQGWGLKSLVQDQVSLEQIFVDITQVEEERLESDGEVGR